MGIFTRSIGLNGKTAVQTHDSRFLKPGSIGIQVHAGDAFKGMEIRVSTRSAGELRKSGVKIKRQEQPFHPLAMLLERPGEVVTREELRQKLWPADTFVDFDRSLNTAASKLREALGDSAENPRFVETLPRRGYRFLAPVEVVGGGAAPVKTGIHRIVSRLALESTSTPILGELLP